MSPESRALAWLHWRRLRGAAALLPAGLLALPLVLLLLPLPPPVADLADLLLLALLPAAAAIVGSAVPGAVDEAGALHWLRARALTPGRLLATGLLGQLLVLALSIVTATILAHRLKPPGTSFLRSMPGEPAAAAATLGRWSETFDAPFGLVVALGLLLTAAAFTWALGLGWLEQPEITAQGGSLLLTGAQATLLVGPAALIGGRAEEALSLWPGLLPGFLAPPVLLAAWAFPRWAPLATPWPARRAAAAVCLVALLSVAGAAATWPRALEVRALGRPGAVASLPGVSSAISLAHPTTPDLVGHELRLDDGATRVLFDDGLASRTVLPRGTRLVGWMQPIESNPRDWRLVVEWPNRARREIGTGGRTRLAMPEALVDHVVRPEGAR